MGCPVWFDFLVVNIARNCTYRFDLKMMYGPIFKEQLTDNFVLYRL